MQPPDGDEERYRVDASGASALLVGDQGTQVNYFYRGTWTDGVAPPPLVSMSGKIDSPYRGLSAFGERDAALFFGREMAATQVLERMSRCLEGTGLLVVSGVSGAGKTSLLGAGVLPRLRGAGLGATPEAAAWPCLVLTPGSRPLEELAVRVARAAGAPASAVLAELTADPARFALIARQAADARPDGAGQQRVLLIVDQLEQLFTQCDSDDERLVFITALHAAATTPGGRRPAALVVLVVRADFEARLADYPLLAPAVQDRYLLTAMTERQLRMAITEPVNRAGSSIDEDLVRTLLEEVRRRPGPPGAAPSRAIGAGVLPLLSHALDQAWRSRAGDALTVADYERTGGIEGAVASSAQGAYGRLTPAQQEAARLVFSRLVATTSDGIDTADRATRAELTAGKDPAQAADVAAVLEAFAAERLLTLAADSVEISHEALLSSWPLLRDTWLAENHADRVTRTRLRATAADWERRSRDPAYLYRGTLLHSAAETAKRAHADPARNPPLGPAERDFLQASNRAHLQAARLRRALGTVLVALTVTATVIAGVAINYAGTASRNAATASRNAANAALQHAVALSRQLAAESITDSQNSEPYTARQVAVAAWSVYPTTQASTAMAKLLAQQQQSGTLYAGDTETGNENSFLGQIDAVAFSPDDTLATMDGNGTVRLWDPATEEGIASPWPARTSGGDSGLAFSPDGKLLATNEANGTIQVWNLATGKPVASLPHADPDVPGKKYRIVTAAVFSHDDKLLATGGINDTVQVWNLATGKPIAPAQPDDTGSTYAMLDVEFSPNGKLLASADRDGTVRLWNPATGKPIGSLLISDPDDPGGGVDDLAFSPNGTLLAGGGDFGTVQLWNLATRKLVESSRQGSSSSSGSVNGVAFSPDGKLLASADDKGKVSLRDLTTGKEIAADLPLADSGSVEAMTFSPDGKKLAIAGYDGTVQLWDLTTERAVGAPLPAPSGDQGVEAASGVAFSPNGKLLATEVGDNAVQLWNPGTGQSVSVNSSLTQETGVPPNLAFSPDGRLLVTPDFGPTLRDLATGKTIDSNIGSGIQYVNWVAFSPDGQLLATADATADPITTPASEPTWHYAVQLWEVATGKRAGPPLRPDPYGNPYEVAFSPDGKLLAVAVGNGTVQLWDVATRKPAGPPLRAAPGGSVLSIAFSPDGKLLATSDGTGTVRVWDLATRKPDGAPMPSAGAPAGEGRGGLAFSPNGTVLVAADNDGSVQLWDVSTDKPLGGPLPASVGGIDGVTFAVALSPGGRLLATGDTNGTVQLWPLSLYTDPYKALCADEPPLTRTEWDEYAPGEPYPKICH